MLVLELKDTTNGFIQGDFTILGKSVVDISGGKTSILNFFSINALNLIDFNQTFD